MPLSQQEFVSNTANITLYDEQLNVTIKIEEGPTPEETAAIVDMTVPGMAEAGARAICAVLERQIVEWDLLDKPEKEGGESIALDADTLYSQVRLSILNDIYQEINEKKAQIVLEKSLRSEIGSKANHSTNGRSPGGQSTSKPRALRTVR